MKMTVKEAFDKCGNIVINYVFEVRCRECGKYYDETDEEYSFEGNLEDFKKWQKNYHNGSYSVIELDDDVEQIEGEERKFNLYREAADEGLCENCAE